MQDRNNECMKSAIMEYTKNKSHEILKKEGKL